MAECQDPFPYNPATLSELRKQLSRDRLETYLRAAGRDEAYAAQLYLYNARLSKSFLFPLHVVEVVLRNAIDESLSHQFGQDWHLEAAFRTILTIESDASLQKAIICLFPNSSEVLA